jgi:hypothetical protein
VVFKVIAVGINMFLLPGIILLLMNIISNDYVNVDLCIAKHYCMKTDLGYNRTRNRTLDIRFVCTDSDNPCLLHQDFCSEHASKIKEELHAQLGHLAHEIARTHGYINVYTRGNEVVGAPQFINFSDEVWDKINRPESHIHESEIEAHITKDEGDYLDHDNYNDI